MMSDDRRRTQGHAPDMNELHADVTGLDRITDQQAAAFRANGLLILRGLIAPDELAALQAETGILVDRAAARDTDGLHDDSAADFAYRKHPVTGLDTPFRIEYILEKSAAARALLGHPFILRTIERLQGPNLIPTWDSMVFKMEGGGAEITWHRDGGLAPGYAADGSHSVNVDVYLDGSDLTNCLWGFPGSNHWSDATSTAVARELNDRRADEPFKTVADGREATPLPVQPGDVMLHSTLAMHGSPAARSALRRVVYLEFRPADVEAAWGPHTLDYIPAKQAVLLSALDQRRRAAYASGEAAYTYRPEERFAAPPARAELDTYRILHGRYWRGTVTEGALP